MIEEIDSKSLVLVLGAGASNEVGLPIGVDLKHRISKALDIRFDNGHHQSSGDHTICEAFRVLARNSDGRRRDINSLIKMSWRIRDAMPQAISIDNFIDSHRHEGDIATCGKLVIARCILQSEANSSLFIDRGNIYNKIKFDQIADTWYNSFFQLMTESCQQEELPARLNKIAVVSFNYDRCFEHYIYNALQNYYAMSAQEAAAFVSNIEIHHPYGVVGELPWFAKNSIDGIDYGAEPSADKLLNLSNSLRTFTEGTNPAISDIDAIRQTIAHADRVLFLGFAFHKLNLDLLIAGPTKQTNASAAIFATAYGLSQSDSNQVRDELSVRTGRDRDFIRVRPELKCAGLLREYWRSLSII